MQLLLGLAVEVVDLNVVGAGCG